MVQSWLLRILWIDDCKVVQAGQCRGQSQPARSGRVLWRELVVEPTFQYTYSGTRGLAIAQMPAGAWFTPDASKLRFRIALPIRFN